MRLRPLMIVLVLALALGLGAGFGALASTTSGDEPFFFPSADGRFCLSAVRIPSDGRKGVVIVVIGRSESWLKYGPLFRDLQRAGYTVYSYDHRGQGLSPHLVPSLPQIGHVDDFSQYGRDLDTLVGLVRQREGDSPIHLIGHSMGAAVIIDGLVPNPPPGIGKIVLCSPMIGIRTSPWPKPLARALLRVLSLIGHANSYAPGEHDVSPGEPFAQNRVTSSPARWEQTLRFRSDHPEAVTGGASVGWISQALEREDMIRDKAAWLGPETLILQAGRDDLVISETPVRHDGKKAPTILMFSESRHEILAEAEPIRGNAVRAILEFLANDHPSRFPLDQSTRNRHTEGTP